MSRRSLITGFLLFAAAMTGYALGLAQEPAAKLPASAATPDLKTLEEQASYAIGLDIARGFADSPELNPELIARGLIDALKKKERLLTTEQAHLAMDQFMVKKLGLGPGAEKNLREGQEFLANNKNKQGVHTTESGLQY